MKTLSVNLEDSMAEALEHQAQEMGITAEELIRFRVGEYVHIYSYKPPPQPAPIAPDYGMDLYLNNVMRTWMAMIGQYNCPACTQKITVADVKAGTCGKCKTPLE